MNRSTKQAWQKKLVRHGFQPWQVAAAAQWSGLKQRGWRRVAKRVFGVKP